MANLTGLFKPEPEEKQDNDKLVDLFRNRAELKKEFAALRDEKYQLQDRIKQHKGETARAQQQMDHLEKLLSDREWVNTVVAYYQLRRLASECSSKLERFAERLKQQREQQATGPAEEHCALWCVPPRPPVASAASGYWPITRQRHGDAHPL